MIRRNAKEETGRPPWFVGGNLGVQVLSIRLTRGLLDAGREAAPTRNEQSERNEGGCRRFCAILHAETYLYAGKCACVRLYRQAYIINI